MLRRLQEKQIDASFILENAENRNHQLKLASLLINPNKIRPILEYASPVWAGLPNYLHDEIERVQSRSLRILGLEKDYLKPLYERREEATSRVVDNILNDPNHPCCSALLKLINKFGKNL